MVTRKPEVESESVKLFYNVKLSASLAFTSSFSIFLLQNMAGYIATFTDVPEPYSALLKSEKRRLPRKNGVVRFVVTGSIPAASTNAGYKTRLKPSKARQCKLPGLVLLVHVSRVFLAFAVCGLIQSRDSPVQNLTRKRLELPQRLGTT